MNKIITLLFFLVSCISNAQQQQKIHFEYDGAGNQTSREWCLNCLAKNSNIAPKEIADLKEEDLQKFLPEDNFSYYPNPVKEELFLKWEISNVNSISSIRIYNLNGSLLKSYEHLNTVDKQTVPFLEYPNGVYILELTYSKGDEKTIKIIKQ
ncbi:T9SS type A sorting domain-containing protein [Flavobacterium aestivum]|uniref:T9SS type A sorting domain-containing protein n=1 Tax=Flavobacterium aestivum TaxID=3003257 RepID=UPI0024829CCF|nr:T9SS type A sorting domain-containing protein [Flavobacterium aestivum]